MPKAIPGLPYTVVKGDTLFGIAKQAYGDGARWREIWRANQSTLISGDPNLIFPGEVVNIPGDLLKADPDTLSDLLPKISGKGKDDFTVIVDGVELVSFVGSMIRTMDTAADGFTNSIAWDITNEKISRALLPYRYPKAKCYLGGVQLVDGILYNVTNKFGEEGIIKDLVCFSPTIDIVDSTVRAPLQAENVTLQQRAKDLVENTGIKVKFDPQAIALDVKPFKRVKVEPTETVFEHLVKLATQRGILISSTPLGELLFTVASTNKKPVATIEEGKPPFRNAEITFDGRSRFNVYKALGRSPRKTSNNAISKDTGIPRSRFFTFQADDSEIGNIQKAADWKRNKALADALTFKIPVDSWYDPKGKLWRENTYVVVKSESMHIPDGFSFLIRAVEYLFEDNNVGAVLDLVPPQAFNAGEIIEPWGVSEESFLDKVIGL
jgi:prophage tail gpP-like protein